MTLSAFLMKVLAPSRWQGRCLSALTRHHGPWRHHHSVLEKAQQALEQIAAFSFELRSFGTIHTHRCAWKSLRSRQGRQDTMAAQCSSFAERRHEGRSVERNRIGARQSSTGTEAAKESSGVALLHGNLIGIVKVRQSSQTPMRNVRLNLGFAFRHKVLGIPVAAGVLFQFIDILLSRVVARCRDGAALVSVVANSLRLRASWRPE